VQALLSTLLAPPGLFTAFLWVTITGLYFVVTFSCALAVERLELGLRRHRA